MPDPDRTSPAGGTTGEPPEAARPACCTASRGAGGKARDEAGDGTGDGPAPQDAPRPAVAKTPGTATTTARPVADSSLVLLPGGTFAMGGEDPDGFPADGEGPVRPVTLSAFRIDRYATSNRAFAEFVEATGHRTDAERYGWSFVFAGLLPPDFPDTSAVVQAPWWRQVYGADWRHPEGPDTSMTGRMDHPVVHVSWHDAVAYCRWAGRRLPTEAEWEHAARGGLEGAKYAWGDELTPGGVWKCNIWQGTFPVENTLDDGHLGTAPVDAFDSNGFGLHNVAGNVWEWCGDWFSPTHAAAPARDPRGPRSGDARVIRGGSYLCHHSYCNRYRVAARTANTPDSSTGNMGFRCAADA